MDTNLKKKDFNFLSEISDCFKNVLIEKFNSEDDNILDLILTTHINLNNEEIANFILLCFVFYIAESGINNNVNNIHSHEISKLKLFFQDVKNNSYVPNSKILMSSYILLSSAIESIKKTKKDNFLFKLDSVLTNNIRKIQNNTDINYDPMKTPIVKEILILIIPFLDSIDFQNKIILNIEKLNI